MVGQARATVHVGGTGEPLLLLHGGWGGAAMHWSSVWTPLAERFRVIAPELPGYGMDPHPSLGSVDAYVRWLAALLDALGVPDAWCVGNSFGATLAWSFGTLFPERCRGIVFVNGLFMPQTPAWMLWLARFKLLRRAMRAAMRRKAYTPRSMERGFADATKIPQELRALVDRSTSTQLETMTEVMIGGGTAGTPTKAPLLIFGECDRLPGTTSADARKLAAGIPGSRLVFIPDAGHLPQRENPDAFLAALIPFLSSPQP